MDLSKQLQKQTIGTLVEQKTMKQKIDPEKYNEALMKYPEYFQDEINYINEIKTIKYNIEDTCNIQQTPNQPYRDWETDRKSVV